MLCDQIFSFKTFSSKLIETATFEFVGQRGLPGESGRSGPRGDPGEGGINSKGTKGNRYSCSIAQSLLDLSSFLKDFRTVSHYIA